METTYLLAQIDQTTEAFQKAFGALSPEVLNRKPNAQTWSIAQCIDHIMVINLTYLPIIQQLRDGTYKLPWHARFPGLVRFFGNFVLQSVHPDRRKKIKTFPIWEPSQSDLPADILTRFTRHQEELKNLITNSHDLLSRGTVITSPASRMIVYKLETAFEIIVTHEVRHLNQALELNSK